MPENKTTRRRNFPSVKLGSSYGETQFWQGTTFIKKDVYDQGELTLVSPGTQVTTSEGHPWSRNKRSSGDIGGDFYTQRNEVSTGRSVKKRIELVDGTRNVGSWGMYVSNTDIYACDPNTITPPSSSASSETQLKAKGTIAIDRCKPTNSVADLGTFLGEALRDGLPSIPGIRSWETTARLGVKAGGEFLNLVFGWQPFISDIKKSAAAIRHAQAVIQQFERDAGRVVRRRYYFPTERTLETAILGNNRRPWYGSTTVAPMNVIYGSGQLIRTRETIRRTWFSGAFTYHLPTGYKGRGEMIDAAEKAKQLLGLDLTPEVLWNITPWSWAVDWVTNAGSVVSNLSAMAKYGLVMKYGYIMEETSVTDTYTFSPTNINYKLGEIAPVIARSVTKQRYGANPFGFGVTWDGLNAIQYAILGALGISRHP